MTPRHPNASEGPKSFLRNEAGIAAVEFALIIPVLLLAYLGATDLTQALAIDRKLSQVSATVSDLVAQEEVITRDEVEAFFQSGIAIMRPFEFSDTKLRLTIVEVHGSSTEVTGVAEHNWEIEARNGDDYNELSADMIDLSDGRFLVVATASYDYEPMFSTIFDASMGLEQRSIHVVRHDVEEFGFEMSEEYVIDDDDQNCAGNSGEHVQGANCENNNNSHGNGGGNGNGNGGGGGNGNGGSNVLRDLFCRLIGC